MKSAYRIDMRRLLLLVRNSLIINRKLILITAAVFSALIIIGRVTNALSGDAPYLYNKLFFLLLYISGFALTNRITRELHDKRKANTWLLLPASTLEKFLTLLFLPTILLAGGLIIYMSIVSLVIEFCIGAFITADTNFFNPFSIEILKGIATYIAIQAPFLLGAIYLKKHAMSYTFLFLFLYSAIFWTFTFLSGMYFLGEYIKPLLPGFSYIDGVVELGQVDTLYAMTVINKLRPVSEIWKLIATTFYWFVAPLLWWASAFFSLKEMEL